MDTRIALLFSSFKYFIALKREFSAGHICISKPNFFNCELKREKVNASDKNNTALDMQIIDDIKMTYQKEIEKWFESINTYVQFYGNIKKITRKDG